MNVFEGARRLAVAVAAICLIGTGVEVWTHRPYVELHYVWNSQNELTHNPFGCSGLPEHRSHVVDDDAYIEAVICGSSEGQDEVTLPPKELMAARDVASKEKLSHAKSAFGYFALFVFVYWAVISGIGWIVRGFFGIPRGKDQKPV